MNEIDESIGKKSPEERTEAAHAFEIQVKPNTIFTRTWDTSPKLTDKGLKGMSAIDIEPGVPIRPTLAGNCHSPKTSLRSWESASSNQNTMDLGYNVTRKEMTCGFSRETWKICPICFRSCGSGTRTIGRARMYCGRRGIGGE